MARVRRTVTTLPRSTICLPAFFLAAVAVAAAPTGPADDAALLSRYAGTPIRLFDPFAADTEWDFRRFLGVVPMANGRPLPHRAALDTASSLAMLRRATAPSAPSYFVATYFQSIATAGLTRARRDSLRARYGEDLFPQRTCPVFASPGNADVSEMLSTASGLAPGFFRDSPGSRSAYHRLFLLTEVSHCGFLARLPDQQALLAQLRTNHELQTFLEALGDHEATIVFRRERAAEDAPDEADVLAAARVVAMFVRRRESAYTAIPGWLLAFERYGVARSAQRPAGIAAAVDEARRAFRRVTATVAAPQDDRETLRRLAAVLRQAMHDGTLRREDHSDDAHVLLQRFPEAVTVVLGEARTPRRRGGTSPALLTLPGAGRADRATRTASVNPVTARAAIRNIPAAPIDLRARPPQDVTVQP
jgi:hypothetical protein